MIATAAMLACGGRDHPPVARAGPPPEPDGSVAPGGAVADPASIERVTPGAARARAQSGQALLVCAYDEARCAQYPIEGAIAWSALQERLSGLPPTQEIILYCN